MNDNPHHNEMILDMIIFIKATTTLGQMPVATNQLVVFAATKDALFFHVVILF